MRRLLFAIAILLASHHASARPKYTRGAPSSVPDQLSPRSRPVIPKGLAKLERFKTDDARYNKAWDHFVASRFQDALAGFFDVAKATANDPQRSALSAAARKALVRSYLEVGKVDKAHAFFTRADPGRALDMLGELAGLYLEAGLADRAIYSYQELMKLAPTHSSVCDWQYQIARSFMSLPGATTADKVTQIENLVTLHTVLKAKSLLPARDAQECRDNAAAMSGDLARAFHAESVKTRNAETMAFADRLYRATLAGFPDAADHAQMQYYAAELAWSRAEVERDPKRIEMLWETAAIAFTDVATAGKLDPKLGKEAAYASVLAWKNALSGAARPKAPPPIQTSTKPQPIPPREAKLLAAFDVYSAYVKDPKDDEVIGMKFLKANLYRRYNQFDKAIPLFEEILDNHRQHEVAEYSANLLLDVLVRLGRVVQAKAVAQKLLADKAFLKDKPDLEAVLMKLR